MLGFLPLSDAAISGDIYTLAVLSGLSATSAVGTGVATAGANMYPSGVLATGALGTTTVVGLANIYPSGVLGTMGIGEEFLWGEIDTSQTPGWGAISTTQTPIWSDVTTP